MRILGIDPGLATIGLGLIEAKNPQDLHAVEWLTIETAPGELANRLREIAEDFTDYLKQAAPDLAVVEKLYFKSNTTNAIDVAQARGVLLSILARSSIEIIEPTPMQLKSCITGDGGADKLQMQEMVVRMLHLTETPQPDDAADALGLAMFGAISKSDARLNTKTMQE